MCDVKAFHFGAGLIFCQSFSRCKMSVLLSQFGLGRVHGNLGLRCYLEVDLDFGAGGEATEEVGANYIAHC